MKINMFQATTDNLTITLDPRTKILLLLAINFFTIAGSSDRPIAVYGEILLALIPFLLLIGSRRCRPAVIYGVFYAAAVVMDMTIIQTATGVIHLTAAIFTSLMIRFLPGLMMSYYMLGTTRISEFLTAMERIHVSQKITIPLAVLFRFFPTILEESRAISSAMRMRRIGIKNAFRDPTAMLEYRMVPLMMSIVKIGDELSAAALTRGLGSVEKRTNICRIGFHIWDAIAIIMVLTAIIFATVL